MKIHVLRLGHRPFRDQRITTHCSLVARAFGAEKMIYTGYKDNKLEVSISKVSTNFGGFFEIEYKKDWKKVIAEYKSNGWLVVHLTVYGLPIQSKIGKIRKMKKDIVIVIGGEKVPSEIYHLADFNISITPQPHSEVAALAIFLHEYFQGKELNKDFAKAKIRIIPTKSGKKIESTKNQN